MHSWEKYLEFYYKESNIYMPNEIFSDLAVLKNRSSGHLAFTYAYYYLTSWLYRYAKYGTVPIDQKKMKEILGYNAGYQGVDYLIKKDGLLDSMNYTETVKDLPLVWDFNDNELTFTMLSEFGETEQKAIKQRYSRKYAIKKPIKAFHRSKESQQDNYEDGTFFEIDNTHLVPFEVFLFCMKHSHIGCTGFYIWSYLQMKTQIFSCGYDVSLVKLADELNLPRSTTINYLNELRLHNMIECKYNQEYFCLALNDEDRKANTYRTTRHATFTDDKVSYKKMEIVKVKEYIAEREGEMYELFS